MVKKIWGVVILYNPETKVVNNINTYLQKLETLIVIDNSENSQIPDLKKYLDFKKCKYIKNKNNQGIGKSLNKAAKLALKNGADWLLTMDQDSFFVNNQFEIMIDWVSNNQTDDVGIVSPTHNYYQFSKDDSFGSLVTMTSGNLLNLLNFETIGEFEERFFIDSIDTEYCLRMNAKNIKLIRLKNVLLKHNLGDIKKYNLILKSAYPTNHSPIRRYYIIRNRLWIWKNYKLLFPNYIKYEKSRTLKMILKIILFERRKILNLSMIIKGFRDYSKGNWGKLQDRKS